MLITLCGLPGSGKTTLSQVLSQQLNTKLYCYDEYKKAKKAKPEDKNNTHQRIFNEIKQDLLSGKDVILDDLHLDLEWRTSLLSSLQDVDCKKILIVLQVPVDICIERDKNRKSHNLGEHVIRHLESRYCPPSLDEGWDDIFFIENNNKNNLKPFWR